MNLRPLLLAATYDRLKILKPFNRWSLPASSRVVFSLSEAVDFWAMTSWEPIEIQFSNSLPWTLSILDRVMAHEMIHVRQIVLGTLGDDDKSHHNRDFHRMAQTVCKELGFDPEGFGG